MIVICVKDFYGPTCMSLCCYCIAEDRQLSRMLGVIDKEPEPIVCPASVLTMYSDSNLAAVIRQLRSQLSRDDPGEEFKVSCFFVFGHLSVQTMSALVSI